MVINLSMVISMRSKLSITLCFAFLASGLLNPVSAAVATSDVINHYPQISTANNSAKQVTAIRNFIDSLLNDGTHRGYPGGFYAEDINKISFWKGVEVATLARTIPYLTDSQKQKLTTFLKYEVDNFLLNSTYSAWELQGDISTKLPYLLGRNSYWQWRAVEFEAVYGLWAYAQYTGDWTTIQNKWSTISATIKNSSSGNEKKFMGWEHYHRSPNSEIAGRLAYSRMAKKLYQTTGNSQFQTDSTSQTNTINTLLNNLANSSSKGMFDSQVCNFEATKTCVVGSDLTSRKAVPFLGQYEFLIPEIARWDQDKYLSATQSVVSTVETQVPWWFLGGYNLLGAGTNEGYYQPPSLANQVFQAKALILGSPVSELEAKLPTVSEFASMPNYWDILNYENLLSLIQRKETVTWVDSNTAPVTVSINTTSSSSSSSSAAPTCAFDFNNDHWIDLDDYVVLSHSFLLLPIPDPRADINKDGFVDLTDYSLMAVKYLQTCP